MRRGLPLLLALCALAAACAGSGDGGAAREPLALTVYSGRNERLIGPLLERYHGRERIEIKVRYGGTSELTATLLEEGPNTPADLFISQDAAALGALSRAGLLRELPGDLIERVPPRFRSPAGRWVGLSGRARVVVYNTERVDPGDLPRTLEEVADPRFRGRFGLAPANASFQAHMALYSALNGERRLRELLEGFVENAPLRYPKNTPIVEAVIAGEIDWGLVNHYYLWRALQEKPEAPARNFFMPGADGSSFVNIAGAGVLSDNPEALSLLRFLLDDEAQRYFAEETYEYPLAAGAEPSVDLPPLEQLVTPSVDYGDVAEALETTLTVISNSGLMQY